MRFVPLKCMETQGAASVFRIRELPIRQRTQMISALRGHLGECGWAVPQGAANVRRLVAMLEDKEPDLPATARASLTVPAATLARLGGQIGTPDAEVGRPAGKGAVARRLMGSARPGSRGSARSLLKLSSGQFASCGGPERTPPEDLPPARSGPDSPASARRPPRLWPLWSRLPKCSAGPGLRGRSAGRSMPLPPRPRHPRCGPAWPRFAAPTGRPTRSRPGASACARTFSPSGSSARSLGRACRQAPPSQGCPSDAHILPGPSSPPEPCCLGASPSPEREPGWQAAAASRRQAWPAGAARGDLRRRGAPFPAISAGRSRLSRIAGGGWSQDGDPIRPSIRRSWAMSAGRRLPCPRRRSRSAVASLAAWQGVLLPGLKAAGIFRQNGAD